jgi:cytochrome c oxidase assembly protein subunit 15
MMCALSYRAFSWATVVLLLGLIVVGTLVNSSRAALSVPDWPLSYGKLLLTKWPGNIFWEQLHRLMVAITGFVLIALAIAVRRESAIKRRLVRGALLLFVIQVLLGGVIVLMLNPPTVGAIHILVAQVIAAMLIVAAGGEETAVQGNRRLAIWTAALIVLQITLGAFSRHPPDRSTFIVALIAHILNGLLLVVFIPIVTIKVMRRTRGSAASRYAKVLLLLIVLQLAVALPLLIISPEPLDDEWPPPRGFRATHAAHVVLATLLLGVSARWTTTLRN